MKNFWTLFLPCIIFAVMSNASSSSMSTLWGQTSHFIECDACSAILPVIRILVETNLISSLNFCAKIKYIDINVCNALIDVYKKSVIQVARNSPLSSSELCSAILKCSPISNPAFNWNLTLPSIPKPPVRPYTDPEPGSPKLRILHLSDLHVDFEYQPGALAECGQPLCCRNTSTRRYTRKSKHHRWQKAVDRSKLAGYWGDYRNCDIPLWTLENMFEHITKNEQFDVIYMTGDLPPHNIWNQTKEDQLNAINVLTDLFLKYFPNKRIYSTLGNHEAAPSNLFPLENSKAEGNISWLYNSLAENWIRTGLPSELKAQISRGAFYTTQIEPGLRLVSLNMNYCYNLNFWLLIDSVDPLGQLAWLIETLQESESMEEKVHIIGHVDPMNCFESWSRNYYKIVNRYESTITGQFFGHTHFDHFEMFYDLHNKSRPVEVAYVAGSVTSYDYENPNYRIYSVDGSYDESSWEVLDHETYYLNLTDANLSMEPKWEKEYSAREAFGLKNLNPESWGGLLDRILDNLNGTLANRLLEYHRSSAFRTNDCDMACRRDFVCKFKQARTDSFISC